MKIGNCEFCKYWRANIWECTHPDEHTLHHSDGRRKNYPISYPTNGCSSFEEAV